MNSGAILIWIVFSLTPAQPSHLGFLYQPAFNLRRDYFPGPTRPYQPQPGDLMFSSDHRFASLMGHYLSRSGPPNHSMIVFRRSDGRLAVLESGAYGNLRLGVDAAEVDEHLRIYAGMGSIWVRCRRAPLTPEQSAALTEFAEAELGKPFARLRVYAQLTPIRSRGMLRTAVLGRPNADKTKYFCSELVMNAMVAACMVPAPTARPSATFPRDMFFGRSFNRFVNRGVETINGDWEPPAHWVERDGGLAGIALAPAP
jgi:hypothetical protein